MHAPAGAPPLPALLSAAVALALLIPVETEAATSREERLQVIKSGRKPHDAAPPPAQPAKPIQTEAERKAEIWRRAELAPPSVPQPADPKTGPAPPGEKVLELPKVTVHSRVEPIKRLPRIETTSTLPPDEHPDPHETPAGRDARLIKKHLTPLQQKLIKLFGGSPAAEAKAAEARALRAAQLNDLATSLEIQEAAGRDAEDIRKLRAEYKKLYYSGPKD